MTALQRIYLIFSMFLAGIGCAHACFDAGDFRTTFLETLPKNAVTQPNIALVRVEEILSSAFVLVSVVKPLRGFETKSKVLVANQISSCDVPLSGNSIGRTFFIAGQLQAREGKRPIFQGALSAQKVQTNKLKEANFPENEIPD